MKNLVFFLVLNLLVNSGFSSNLPYKYHSISEIDSTKIEPNNALKKLFEKGIEEYSNYNYNKAINTWKSVLKKADVKKDSSIIIKSNINIGSSYNALGYHKTALNYFLKSDKIFNSYQIKNEPYWANHINIGVCYMSLEQFDLSKSYFDKTTDFNTYIIFLKKLNLAKWHAVQNKQAGFLNYQTEIEKLVGAFPMYIDIWNELQLDFFIKWKNKPEAKELIEKLRPVYDQQNLYLKLLINKGSLFVYNKTIETSDHLQSFADEVSSRNDLYLTELYYSVLKEHYYKSNNLKQFYYYNDLWIKNNDDLNKEKNMLHVEDFKEAQELEELKNKFSEVQLKNELIQNQLSKSTIMFRFSMVIIIMGLGIIFLMVRNYKKNKEIHSLSVIQSQNELLKKEFEKLELSENLKETAEELNTSIVNIKKVALLKKQLENIVDEKSPNYNEKETLKKLKLCLNSFFDNYRELTQMIQKKLNVDKIVDTVRKDHPEISDKEIRVIEYIALHFTTKEIALLMDKSEKSVEYYRSQIRKKMQLKSNSTLEEYLNAQVKGMIS